VQQKQAFSPSSAAAAAAAGREVVDLRTGKVVVEQQQQQQQLRSHASPLRSPTRAVADFSASALQSKPADDLSGYFDRLPSSSSASSSSLPSSLSSSIESNGIHVGSALRQLRAQIDAESAMSYSSSSSSSSSSASSSSAAAAAVYPSGDQSLKTDTLAALFPLIDADTLACMLEAHAGNLAATIRTVAGDGVFDAPTADQSAAKRAPHDAHQAAAPHHQQHQQLQQPQKQQQHQQQSQDSHHQHQHQPRKPNSSAAESAAVPRPLFDPREHEQIAADGNLTRTQKQMFYTNGCVGFWLHHLSIASCILGCRSLHTKQASNRS
jgi:hypothetical protein